MVVRGLTADELWICVMISAMAGILIGLRLLSIIASLAILLHPYCYPLLSALSAMAVSCTARNVIVRIPSFGDSSSGIASHYPLLARSTGGLELITRRGYWSTRHFTGSRQ